MNLWYWQFALNTGLLKEIHEQKLRVPLPFPQGGDAEIKHVEPIEKVGTQATVVDFLLRNLVGRGNDANLDRDDLVVANAHDLARLQCSEQFGLQKDIHFRQFIQKQGCLHGPVRTGRSCRTLMLR